MNDIPEMYLAEAVRRLNAAGKGIWTKNDYTHCYVITLARTLQELGWTPPVDEARMAKARKALGAAFDALGQRDAAYAVRVQDDHIGVQAAYDALGED
jgi:hypothetical protein